MFEKGDDMIQLLTGISLRTWLIAGAMLLAVGFIAYQRADAVRDAEQTNTITNLENRIETKEMSNVRDSKIRSLSDCELERDGINGVSGDAVAARAAFQRCLKEATQGQARNDNISSPK